MTLDRSDKPWTLEFYRNMARVWDAFWFSSTSNSVNTTVRMALGVVMCLQFLLHCLWVPSWLTGNGWLNESVGRYLIGQGMEGTGSEYRWSLLYLMGSSGVAWGICIAGLLASVLMVIGYGGRAVVLLVWGCAVMIHQRSPWLTLPAETLQIAALLYLAIEPGVNRFAVRRSVSSQVGSSRVGTSGSDLSSPKESSAAEYGVLANLAMRCMQVHWILWLVLAASSMLQQVAWWNGTAAAVLSEQGAGMVGLVPRSSLWGQLVTLGVLVVHFSTAIFLVNRRSWGFAVISSALLAIGLVVIAGDWMMGGMVIVFLLAFQGNSRSE